MSDDLANALADAEIVESYIPYDVSHIKSGAVQALVLLANSLGWTITQRPRKPIVLVHEDGKQIRLPTDQTIRITVYQTAMASIVAHSGVSGGKLPGTKLVDKIIEVTKLERDHARRLRGMLQDEYITQAEHDAIHSPDELDATTEDAVTHPVFFEPGPRGPIETAIEDDNDRQEVLARREEVMARRKRQPRPRAADGGVIKETVETPPVPVSNVTKRSPAVDEVTFEDGTVLFRCTWPGCGAMYKGISSVGSHYKRHSGQAAQKRRGEIRPRTSDTEKLQDQALMLLDAVQQFVKEIESIDATIVSLRGSEARIIELEGEVARLRVKANRWDALRAAMGDE